MIPAVSEEREYTKIQHNTMATEETVKLNDAHAPQQASIDALDSILETVKEELVKLRRDHDKHEPEYFRAVKHVSDSDLTSFTARDLEAVRVAVSAYGLHLFGKIRLPAVDDGYIHVRLFGSSKDGTDGSSADEREYNLHSIHTEEVIKEDGDRVYRAVFGRGDELECFKIVEARIADAHAIASLFAQSWVSPFSRLQFGQLDPEELATSMSPRIAQQMMETSSRFIVARNLETGKVAAVAQWMMPVVADLGAVKEESKEDRDERQQFEDEVYRGNLPEKTLPAREPGHTPRLSWQRPGEPTGRWATSLADKQQVLVYLDTASDNPAARLYKRLGFEEQGRNIMKDLTSPMKAAERSQEPWQPGVAALEQPQMLGPTRTYPGSAVCALKRANASRTSTSRHTTPTSSPKLATWSDGGYTPPLYGFVLTGNPGQHRPTPRRTQACRNQRSAASLGSVPRAFAGGWEHILRDSSNPATTAVLCFREASSFHCLSVAIAIVFTFTTMPYLMSKPGHASVSRKGKQWPAFPGIPIFLETHDDRKAPKTYGTTQTTPTTPTTPMSLENSQHRMPLPTGSAHLTAPDVSPIPTSPTTTIQTSSSHSSMPPLPQSTPEVQYARRPTLQFFPTQYPRVRVEHLPTLQIPSANEKTPINTQPGLGILNAPPGPPTIHISSPVDEKDTRTEPPTNIAQRIEETLWRYTRSGNALKRWLLEIISWFFSLACMIAIIAVLATLQDEKLDRWWVAEKTGLTLNAYISVLSKMAGAALILPVSEALGQLKWNWFLNHSKQMWDYEIFDNASRGPWGSFLLLIRTKCKALAALGAIITLASLMLDPFFQQVVDFPDRWSLNSNSSALPRVVEYKPLSFPESFGGWEMIVVDQAFYPIVTQFMVGNGTQPIQFGNGTRPDIPLSCPTSNCTWQAYETLGVCSECADVRELLDYSCRFTKIDWSQTQMGPIDESAYQNGTVCGYFLNATSDTPILMTGYILNHTMGNLSVSETAGNFSVGETLLARTLPLTEMINKTPLFGGSVKFKHLRNSILDTLIVSSADPFGSNPWDEIPIALECVLSWCVKTVESSYNLGEYSENITSIFQNTTEGPFPWESTEVEGGGETITMSVYNEDIMIVPPNHSRNLSAPLVYNETYRISNTTASNAIMVFDDYIPSSYTYIPQSESPMLRYKNFAGGPYLRKLGFNPLSAPNNITQHFDELAIALTNVMRSDPTSKEMLPGSAYSMENYIAVRWEWLSLPLGLLLSTLVFLSATIATSAVDGEGVGVWKTSAIATLLYGLPDDVQKKLTSAEDGTPRAKAKELKVRLQPNMGWRVSGNIFSPFTPKPRSNQPPPGWI
ncbi:hypothetical protein OPT61_g4392 [Boeremia exigua]|uniref:Uncharacterized protein n=1 Tax=Boeremia exigua TaxID=749465 RepID=A0ACC2IE61_9PLEO|nr:hypothetical protein OPT61_g4392 [Boeremia exigua]